MTTKAKTRRTICDKCLHALTHFAPIVGPDASPFATVNHDDGTYDLYERVPGHCDWCDHLRPLEKK